MSDAEGLTASIGERTEAQGLPAHEAITQAAETVGKQTLPLPGFEPPPYNAEEWNRKIASKSRAVEKARAEYKSAQEDAGRLRKIAENEADGLTAMIRYMDEQRRRAEGELVQPSLRPVAQGVAGSSCRYEQETGEPCPGCILLRKHGCPLPDPEDTEHATVVREALEQADDRDGLLTVLNTGREEAAFAREMVEGWSVDEARLVSLWLTLNANLPRDANQVPVPDVLTTTIDLNAEIGIAGPVTYGTISHEPTTAAEALEQAADAAKVCLCQGKPKFKKGKCTTCGGAKTGETKGTH